MDKPAIAEQLHTMRDYLRFGVSSFNRSDIFYGHGTDNAWDEALAIVLHVLDLPYDSDEKVLDARLLDDEKLEVLSLFELRIEEKLPVPYLTGNAWFAGLEFNVDQRVLIPRSPIAQMIESYFQPWYQGQYPYRILDLCTGSGCIGIACAYAYEDAEVVLSDLSEDALDVAQSNIERHDLEDRVSVLQSDLLAEVDGQFDLIVSNPPYVDAEDFHSMPSEYGHEPAMALESGELGLYHPLQILRQASEYLTDDGILVLEVGNSGQHLEDCYPGVDFNWVEFPRGGHGVLVISKAELDYYAEQLLLEPEKSSEIDDFYGE